MFLLNIVIVIPCTCSTLKKTSHKFSHLMLSLLISIAHREPQSRIFEHSAWCHPPRNCKQWYIHEGLWMLGFTSGLTFLNLFKMNAPSSAQLLKEGRVPVPVTVLVMAAGCCILFLGSGKLWTGWSEPLFVL